MRRSSRRISHRWGVLVVAASVGAGWFAFSGAAGEEGSAQSSLFYGSASIMLMAWANILAVRIGAFERAFGGLDFMYRVHRWAGALAVPAMLLHSGNEPEIEGGVPGASRTVTNQAEGLAETAQTMLLVLVVLSLLRWLPYRWWRLTHKLMGVPFAFACWHFYTATKPYANGSAWGWWFGGFMVAGLVAYVWRVLWRDIASPGRTYRVTTAAQEAGALRLELRPEGRRLRYREGQFAYLKVQRLGLSEPHAFTIASSPDSPNLEFYIRGLGDWSDRLQSEDLVGTEVVVEGPYGRFEPVREPGEPTVWVAGGVGITPFLSALDALAPAPAGQRPVLCYCVASVESAVALDRLERADRDGRIDLRLYASDRGERLDADELERLVCRSHDAAAPHMAVCGPSGLAELTREVADRCGVGAVEFEDFDMRGGVGRDLSRPIAALAARVGA